MSKTSVTKLPHLKREEQFTKYMIMAATHSRNNAKHWFRYLSKIVDKYQISFSEQVIGNLCESKHLTPFQKVSLRQTFTEHSPTREYVLKMNNKYTPIPLTERMKQIEEVRKANKL